MKNLSAVLVFIVLIFGAGAPRAMMVDCPSFPDKVRQAQLIFDGTVTKVATRQADLPNGRGAQAGSPHTFYTFAMRRVFKGGVAGGGDTVTLRFEGGDVYGFFGNLVASEDIPGVPQFKKGERAILFVKRNGDSMSPLVCMSAAFRIPQSDDLPDGAQEAWITADKKLIFKPSEERLRHLVKMLEDAIIQSHRDIDRINKTAKPNPPFGYPPFEVHIKDLMSAQGSDAEYLTPQGTWTPPPGAIPYDPDAYANSIAERIERELTQQALDGTAGAPPRPVESQDIRKPFYVNSVGRALDANGKRLTPDAP